MEALMIGVSGMRGTIGGTLTPDENVEMDAFERAGSILSTLKSKARQVLKRSNRGG